MEILLTLLIAALLGLGGLAYYLSSRLKSASAIIAGKDEALARLRSELVEGKRANLELEALVKTVDGVAHDVILVLDAEQNVIFSNQPLRGQPDDAIEIGKPFNQTLRSAELKNLVEMALRENEVLEERIVIGDANYRVRLEPLRVTESAPFVGIAMQDITDLVHLNRARRDLVANISHELRTPITRIRLIIEGLFLDADKPKRKASIQSLKEIAMETDSLLWLAQELLDLSMIESGQAILRLVKTPLNEVVEDAIARLESQAATKNLKIVSHVPQKYAVLCDADQLRRVLGNLLHNAIKWSPENDAITITAAENAEEIVVTVFDNGPGVEDEVRDRIFERFYQADISRSGDEGTGLGLAICKHIIEAHGGRIWAEGNSQGMGGQFLFTVLKADADFQDIAARIEEAEPALELP